MKPQKRSALLRSRLKLLFWRILEDESFVKPRRYRGSYPGTPVVPGGRPIYQSVLNVARRYLQTRCEEGSELELHVQAAFAH